LAVPRVLDGRYRLERLVAQGGFGDVYQATHLELETTVALKLLRGDDELDAVEAAEQVGRFIEEARMVQRLRHPHVARVFDAGVAEQPYLALEWCDGPTLKSWIVERDAPPALDEVWALFAPIAAAIAHAHAHGVAHRDIKPSNVVLARDGERIVPKVLDFGIAKAFGAEARGGSGATRTRSGWSPRTLAYAAPEQLARGRTGPWTDVHGLGLLFCEMCTLSPPYGEEDGRRERAVAAERPTPARFGIDAGAFEGVCRKAVSLRPDARYRDAGELLAAFEAAAAGRRPARRWWIAGAIAATAGLAAAGWSLGREEPAVQAPAPEVLLSSLDHVTLGERIAEVARLTSTTFTGEGAEGEWPFILGWLRNDHVGTCSLGRPQHRSVEAMLEEQLEQTTTVAHAAYGRDEGAALVCKSADAADAIAVRDAVVEGLTLRGRGERALRAPDPEPR
jgi:hypothetical protein